MTGSGPDVRSQQRSQQGRREENRRVLQRLRLDAVVLSREFELPLQSIEAERPNVKRRYGVCFDDGSIRIRLRHVRTGDVLKYSSLVDTLCHELAHLRHFDHGPRFEVLYQRILDWARSRGIYRPASRSGPGRASARQGPALTLRHSSILPLARLQPVGRTSTSGASPGSGSASKSLRGRGGSGGNGAPGPKQLELFR